MCIDCHNLKTKPFNKTFIVLDTAGTAEANAELAEAYRQSGDADRRREPETAANLQFDAVCRHSFAWQTQAILAQ